MRAATRLATAWTLAALIGGCTGRPAERVSVGAPSPALHLDAFYAKSVDAAGIPVSASTAVPDEAVLRARSIVLQMLSRRPNLATWLKAQGQRVVVMGDQEGTVDLPEQRDWRKPAKDDPRLTACEIKHYDAWIGALSDREYWNARARGMGGLLTSAATENLLAVPGTKYYGENILVHEFSHAILDAVEQVAPDVYAQVGLAYEKARTSGLWRGEYGETTVQEYWAEGTQFWFESNKLAVVNGERVLSARDLRRHDPALYAALRQVYGHRHRLAGDVYWRHPARVPEGPPPTSTAAVC